MSRPQTNSRRAQTRPSRLRTLGLLTGSAARAAAATLMGPIGLTSSVAAAAPAAAATGAAASCPDPYPAASLTRGDAVTGLTVTEGTTPEEFTGEHVGTSTEPDGTVARGVWAGMSGSPVYAADGHLVGAVS